MPWYKKLHWQIIVGLIFGLLFGVASVHFGWNQFTKNWINPWGVIFVNLLKLIAVPLVLASLITGVASLSDIKKLSRIGGKTIAIYIGTTLVALVIGVTVANTLKPGLSVPAEMRERLQEAYKDEVAVKSDNAQKAAQRGPLQPIVDMVPSNFFGAASNNRAMLQIVFFCILFGISLIQVPNEKGAPIINFFHALNEVVIKMVDIIMLMAPLGVFALIAKTVTAFSGDDTSRVIELLGALGYYCFAVVLGLALHTFGVLPTLLRLLSPVKVKAFFKAIAPAQLLAFSTSSSGATLPVTMECAEQKLGVSEEVSSFV